MDLEQLRVAYEGSERQIEILNQCLNDMLWRQQQTHLCDDQAEFHYLHFKLTTLRAIRDLYQEYNDHKWKQLQAESTLSLEEILHGNHGDQVDPLTPPMSPNRERIEEDLHIHMIPAPIAPISDMDSLSLTPPRSRSPSPSNRFFYSSSLGAILQDEYMARDF